jgi:flagellar biosynthesis protein FlhG
MSSAPRPVAVVSGKGGVGKTHVVVGLGVAAAARGLRVLIVDGDLGLANVDVLLGLAPERSVADVVAGSCALEEAVIDGPGGIRILPAASGRAELASLGGPRLARLVAGLWQAAREYDLVLLDAGAGIGVSVVGLAAACTRGLLVSTPEPTSLADAYATRKVLRHYAPGLDLELLVNQADSELEAHRTHSHLDRLSRRFLSAPLPWAGFLPRDPKVAEAALRQQPVPLAFPQSAFTRRLLPIADALVEAHRTEPHRSGRVHSSTGSVRPASDEPASSSNAPSGAAPT